MLGEENISIPSHKFPKTRTYICSIHFVDPIEENADPIYATSLTERSGKRKKNSKKNGRKILIMKHSFTPPFFKRPSQNCLEGRKFRKGGAELERGGGIGTYPG